MSDRYEYTGTGLYRSQGNEVELIEPGDVVEPTEAELDAFGDSFRPIDDASGDTGGGTPPDEEPTATDSENSQASTEADTSTPPFAPGDLTIEELDEEIAEGDYSTDELQAVLHAEQNGEDRTGAVDVIEAHLEA